MPAFHVWIVVGALIGAGLGALFGLAVEQLIRGKHHFEITRAAAEVALSEQPKSEIDLRNPHPARIAPPKLEMWENADGSTTLTLDVLYPGESIELPYINEP